MSPMDLEMFRAAKWSFSTRRVDRGLAQGLVTDVAAARAGDLVLGRIISISQHPRIQLPQGRPSTLYPGDLIVMPCGARYAPDQFEGIAKIDPEGCDMLAGGGCLGQMVGRNELIKPPTRVQPLGLVTDAKGVVINVADFAISKAKGPATIPIIAVLGTAMNSGKTTATVALSYGLTKADWRVATIKATGTGAFGDYNDYVDSGAVLVSDFTDAGMVTTFLEPLSRVKAGIADLLWQAETWGAEIVVMEIADGLYQRETAALIADSEFRNSLAGVIFACGDALAATGGVAELARLGIRPLLLTGVVSCSPMATQEAETATGVGVMRRGQLQDPAEANRIATLVGALPRNRVAA